MKRIAILLTLLLFFSTSSFAACDAQTSLMLHYDGTNGSTTVIDSSLSNHTMTPHGNFAISTTQSKFGGTSGSFDGTNSYVSVASSPDFAFGTSDYTVDFWVYFNSTASDQTFFDNPGSLRFMWFSGALTLDGAAGIYSQAWSPSAGQWYHLAASRNGTNLRVFVNGVQLGTTVTDSTNIASSNTIVIGQTSNVRWLNGFMDEMRFSKGIARWTANFTPPTSAYCGGASTGTFLSFCEG